MTTTTSSRSFTDRSAFIARARPGDRFRQTRTPFDVSDYLATEVCEVNGHRAVTAQGTHTQHIAALACYRTHTNPVTLWIDDAGHTQHRVNKGTGPVTEYPCSQPTVRDLFDAHQIATGR